MSIPVEERGCEVTGRKLEEYLSYSQLEAEDLQGKVVLNLGSGGSDLEEELRKRKVFPKAVSNIDIAYYYRRGKFLKGWMRPLHKRSTGIFIPVDNNVCADMCSLPIADGEIDYCFAVWSLSSYLSEERKSIAIPEIIRVLKPNGRAFVYPIAHFEEELAKGIMNSVPLSVPLDDTFGDTATFAFLKPATYKAFWTLEVCKN